MQLGVAIKIIKQKIWNVQVWRRNFSWWSRHKLDMTVDTEREWELCGISAAAACDVIARESDSHSHIDNVSSQVQARHHNWLCRRARKSFCRETSPIRWCEQMLDFSSLTEISGQERRFVCPTSMRSSDRRLYRRWPSSLERTGSPSRPATSPRRRVWGSW